MTQDPNVLPRKYFVQVEYWDCGSILQHKHKTRDAALECMRKAEVSKQHKDQKTRGIILGIEMMRMVANGSTVASVAEKYEVDKSRVTQRMSKVIWLMRCKRLFPVGCNGDIVSIRENKEEILFALDVFEGYYKLPP